MAGRELREPLYTFLFVTSPVPDEAMGACSRALERLSSTLPNLGSPGRITITELPELSAALATLLPEVDRPSSLLQVVHGERLVALTYGERPGTPRLAQLAHDVFGREGAAAVAALDGNFSALLIERSTRSIWLCGTLLGHRALYHARAGARFLASSHDLTLLATGLLPREPDLVSLASMLSCDWSLESRPLLASARRCHPLELVRHRAELTEVLPLSATPTGSRLHARDRTGIQRQVERVAEELEQSASSATTGLERIEAALTAGLDSRALWATLCHAARGRPLIATTTGAAHSLDVRVARRLAHSFGAEHVRREVDTPTAGDFTRVLELMAFFAGGDTNGKRALTSAPSMAARRPFAGGTGGEIFRGFFYPYVGASPTALSNEQLADKLLRWRFRRYDKLHFRDSGARLAVRQRLLLALERSRAGSQGAHDVLDLFYLLERYGRWGARPACFPWNAVWTPFESVAAIRAALRLPAPRGSWCTAHALLIRRHLPLRAYWTPINAGPFAALQGPGWLRHWLRQGLGVRGLVQQKLERRVQRESATPDDLRARILAQELQPVVRALLQDSGSLSLELLGASGVERLLSEHESKRNQLPLLGVLLTAEQWWRLARRLA